MIHQVITRVSLDSFRERAAGKKIVLLYPWTNYRNLFLGHFLANDGQGLLYYCVYQDAETLSEWLQDYVNQMDSVLGDFSKELRNALNDASPESLGHAFAADLGAYSSSPVTLFVDELDRVPFDDEFNAFIQAVVEALPDHAQVAFSSRLLTYDPWYDLIAADKAVVLGTEYRKNDVMFTVEDEIKPQVEVYGFGRGHALVNGQEITNWDGALPRNLFFYFIDKLLVTRDDIFTTFWPNLSVKEATNVFHVTKRKISERISIKVDENENFELTRYASGFYMPSDKVVRHYDVVDFQEAVETGMITSNEEEREVYFRRAVDLYKAPFLETINMDWVNERRFHLRQLYAQALIGMGRLTRKRDDNESALGFLARALKEVPGREDVHRDIIEIYAGMNMMHDARNQYEVLREYLKDMYNVEPANETRLLFDRVVE